MIALDSDTAMQVAEAVDQSMDEVFQMMTGQGVNQVGRSELPVPQDGEFTMDPSGYGDLTVTLSLDGQLRGTIGICLPKACALDWTETLIDHKTEEIDQTVVDACGELGNMVVGGAKRRITGYQLKIGLPNVIIADRNAIVFPSGVKPLNLEFEVGDSSIQVFVALASS